MTAVRWFFVGDHGKVAHAFPAAAGGIYHAYCGRGPGWIEAHAETVRCKSCLRRLR